MSERADRSAPLTPGASAEQVRAHNRRAWDAQVTAGNRWTVPVGLGITRTTVFSGRPMSLGVQYYHNAKKPDGAAGQLLRITVSLLYPRK